MANVVSVDTAMAFLTLCESDNEEYQLAVKLVREHMEKNRALIIELRNNTRQQVATHVDEHKLRYERRITTLEQKLDDERTKIEAIEKVLDGEDY